MLRSFSSEIVMSIEFSLNKVIVFVCHYQIKKKADTQIL